MTITKNSGRQEPIVANIDISLADLVGGYVADGTVLSLGDLASTVAKTTSIALPVGAVVVGGSVTVEQAFNSTSTDVITLGDATTADRYIASSTVHAVGILPIVPTGFIHTSSEAALKLTWTSGGGTPTTGRLRIAIQYYVVADVVTKTVNLSYTDLTSGVALATAIGLPVDSVIIGGSVNVLTEFDSVTSDMLVVGDVTTANRYLASHTLQATGVIPLVPTGFVNTATQSALQLTWTEVGGSTAHGAIAVTVSYYVAKNIEVIELPRNAVVLSGGVTVSTAFNSGTSDALMIGEADSPSEYLSSFSIASTGRTPLVPTGAAEADRVALTARWVRLGSTAPTTGKLNLDVKYHVLGRASFSQD